MNKHQIETRRKEVSGLRRTHGWEPGCLPVRVRDHRTLNQQTACLNTGARTSKWQDHVLDFFLHIAYSCCIMFPSLRIQAPISYFPTIAVFFSTASSWQLLSTGWVFVFIFYIAFTCLGRAVEVLASGSGLGEGLRLSMVRV